MRLTLSGRSKTKTFFTVENDGDFGDPIKVRCDKPNARTLGGKIFRLTGGRRNVSAQVFCTGLVLAELAPTGTTAFQGEWSRKSATLKANQTLRIRSTSGLASKSDAVGTKVNSK